MNFFFFLYNFFFIPVNLIFNLVNFRARRKGRGRSYMPSSIIQGGIWVHAASVGEVKGAEPLIAELKKVVPDKPIYISTVTTGGQEAAKKVPQVEETFYFPFDLPISMYLLYKKLAPWRVVIMETELWPNLISMGKRKSRLYLANGRLSIQKMPTYKKLHWIYRPLLEAFSALCLQSRDDGERVRSLGIGSEKLYFPGNLKLDGIELAEQGEKDNLVVAGSTHQGEEELLLNIYGNLLQVDPELKIILAPRHLERIGSVEKMVREKGYAPGYWTENGLENSVTILDTMGQLVEMYRRARLVFVGGSLVPKGGHNPLEALGKPLFFGPHMENWQEMAGLLCGENLAFQVENGDELSRHWEDFIKKGEDTSRELEEKARIFKEKNAGSARQTATIIVQEKRKG